MRAGACSLERTHNVKQIILSTLATTLLLATGCGQNDTETPAPAPAKSDTRSTVAKPVDALDESVTAAVWEGKLDAVKTAIEGGVGVNDKEPAGGSSLLNLAAMRGHKDVVAYLIEKGADLESKNNEGNTALYHAAFFCHPEVLSLLIEKGAEVNVTDNQGATPLVVSTAEWSTDLEGLYKFIGGILKMDLDLERIKSTRGTIAKILAENGGMKTKE